MKTIFLYNVVRNPADKYSGYPEKKIFFIADGRHCCFALTHSPLHFYILPFVLFPVFPFFNSYLFPFLCLLIPYSESCFLPSLCLLSSILKNLVDVSDVYSRY